MDKYTLSSQYYIVLGDNQVIDQCLPEGITFFNQTLNIDTHSKVELQVIYQVQKELKVTIHIQPRVEIDMIETKMMASHAILNKDMMIEHDAIVHTFSENLYHNDESIQCVETTYLKENANSDCGYAELSDGSNDSQYHYYLDGEGASAKVRMAILSKEVEKKHFEVLIQHNYPHTYGQMDNYGVAKDEGHLIIDGIGTITKGQHGSSSHQTNKIMVFDEKCVAGANPYLYIDDYDVKASHAAGVGKMDEEHLYYLQSRGLSKKQAMQLITYGYLKPVMDFTDNEQVKERFEKALLKVGD